MPSIALLGAAHIHTPNFAERLTKRPDVKVAAIWDHDEARARKYTERFGAKFVSDPAEIAADKDITAVVVCSETNRHEALVIPQAQAGKHLFVEKPLGMGALDSGAMLQEIQKANVIFSTGFFRRSNKAYRTLKSLVEKGVFGNITRVRECNMHQGAIGGWFDTDWRWMADPTLAGAGGFGDLGYHSLDILIWLLGGVERVTGLINPVTRRYGDCDETGEAILKFRNGANGTLGAGWVDHGNPVSTDISGTAAHAYIRDGQVYLNSKEVTGQDGFQPYSEFEEDLPHAFELFLDAIGGKKDLPLVSVVEAAYGSAVMEAIYRGAADRRWVEVPDIR